jgi:alanyl-tRNA synthetase
MAELIEGIKKMSTSQESDCGWPAAKVRAAFMDYFQSRRGHTFWPASPVVPVNDPTILFTNAGMNQYKPLFLGTCDPSDQMYSLKRAVNSQKCIRAGGKHNDLDDVGKDTYHHTYFEMLGNWSFGDYFKEEAINWAFECLTQVFGLDPDRLYASYFGGDEALGLQPDLEAKAIWERLLPAERVLPFGKGDNFWEMGNTGPCGPCSEIHYDRLGGRDASSLVNADLPDVIEIWNLVFIQFNCEADGSLRELPNKHVDTGMGFERLASILQGKQSNYDTDIFTPLFAGIQAATGCRPYTGMIGAADKDVVDMAYRVVADHIRTLTFSITDGAVPSAEGRGYVLRRILRRAVRYGQEILKAPAGFFHKLVPLVVENFKDAFPEIEVKAKFVMNILDDEETSFNRTLEVGVRHFKKVCCTLEATGSKVIPAKDAHILFGSMGFPLDLTQLMAEEHGFTVDTAGFEALMQADRAISEEADKARKGGGGKDMTMVAEQTAWLTSRGVVVTDTSSKYTWHKNTSAKVLAIYEGRGTGDIGFISSASPVNGIIGVVVDQSSFYYESGGQTFDTGELRFANGNIFIVSNTQTYAGYVLHCGTLEGDSLSVGDSCETCVDYSRRALVAPNHTMTHVLNFALRKVLITDGGEKAAGLSIDQKGSLVDEDKLRFDFSWSGPLTTAQVKAVEEAVVSFIDRGVQVYAEVVPLAKAQEISSLRAVFGERYPDPVRVLSVGADIQQLLEDPKNEEKWGNMSIEFCGGTHLTNCAEAEDCVVVEETGIAKGIRRIVGLTKHKAKIARAQGSDILAELSTLRQRASAEGAPTEEMMAVNSALKSIKVSSASAVISLVTKAAINDAIKGVENFLRTFNKTMLTAMAAAATEKVRKFCAESTSDKIVVALDIAADGKIALSLMNIFKELKPDASVLITSVSLDGDKVGIWNISPSINCKDWLNACTTAVGSGKGGGKPNSATGNIPVKGENAEEIVKTVLEAGLKFLD